MVAGRELQCRRKPNAKAVVEGDSVTLSCVADFYGYRAPILKWYFGAIRLKIDSTETTEDKVMYAVDSFLGLT